MNGLYSGTVTPDGPVLCYRLHKLHHILAHFIIDLRRKHFCKSAPMFLRMNTGKIQHVHKVGETQWYSMGSQISMGVVQCA